MTTNNEIKAHLLDTAHQDLPSTDDSHDPALTPDTPATVLLPAPEAQQLDRSDTDQEINDFIDNPTDPADGQENTEALAGIEDEEEEISERAAMWGAAGAGCGVGYVIGGVFLAAVGAAGGAYAATREGKVGDAARSTGRVAVTMGRKAKQFNEKHKVTEKAKKACVAAYHSIKEVNEKHHITERTGKAFKGGYEKAKSFNEKHQITTKVASAAATGMQKVENALAKKSSAATLADAPSAEDAAIPSAAPIPPQAAAPTPTGTAPVRQTPGAYSPPVESFV